MTYPRVRMQNLSNPHPNATGARHTLEVLDTRYMRSTLWQGNLSSGGAPDIKLIE
jgi:hypothetical protein